MQRAVLLALVCLGFAGCADSPEEGQTGPDLNVYSTAETGIIRGTVVDDAIVPVAGALVALANTNQEMMTDEEGRFGFAELDPGTYFVNVGRIGFRSGHAVVTVEAAVDETEWLRILIPRDATLTPRVEVHEWNGHLACGTTLASCAGTSDLTGDEFETDHFVLPDIDFLQTELVWESNQQASQNLKLWQDAGDCGSFDFAMGPSPVIINTSVKDMGRYGTYDCYSKLGDLPVHLRVFAGGIEGTENPQGECYTLGATQWCNGIGVVVEQEFQTFTHVFHEFQPPPGWQFGRDGAPTVPS